jgi:hypothetical protein
MVAKFQNQLKESDPEEALAQEQKSRQMMDDLKTEPNLEDGVIDQRIDSDSEISTARKVAAMRLGGLEIYSDGDRLKSDSEKRSRLADQ